MFRRSSDGRLDTTLDGLGNWNQWPTDQAQDVLGAMTAVAASATRSVTQSADGECTATAILGCSMLRKRPASRADGSARRARQQRHGVRGRTSEHAGGEAFLARRLPTCHQLLQSLPYTVDWVDIEWTVEIDSHPACRRKDELCCPSRACRDGRDELR